MSRVTASKLPLLEHCTYWARPETPWNDSGSEEARALGNAMHARAEAHVDGRELPPVPSGVDASELELLWRPLVAWLDENSFAMFETEVPFAFDVDTGVSRRLAKGEHRGYVGSTPTEICGTADLVGRTPDGTLWVVDLKSGRATLDGYDAQLDGVGLMAARAMGESLVEVTAFRPRAVGANENRSRRIDLFELEDNVEAMRARLEDFTSPPNPGAWCTEKYCPSVAACPAQSASSEALVPVAGPFSMTLAIQSPEHAVWLRDHAKLVAEAAEQVLGKVKEYARERGGLPTKPGKVWRSVPSTRSTVDGKAALALAERMNAPPEDLAACMRSVVVESFREVNATNGAA